MTFLRTTQATYTASRDNLDALWGHPRLEVHHDTQTEVVTVSCLPSHEDMVKDDQGRVYVAINEAQAEWSEVSLLISSLVSQGLVEEITKEQHLEILPTLELP